MRSSRDCCFTPTWTSVPRLCSSLWPSWPAPGTGGWRLGLLATVISDGLGAYFVLRPFERTETDYIADSIEIALFSASGFGISCIAEQLRSARRRAEANEQAAKEALSQVKALSGLLPIC